MALTAKSSFLYGLEVTVNNRSLDFVAVMGGPTLLATLNLGFYSLTDLTNEVARAMQAVDAFHTYTVTADRTVSSGTQNRVTVATSGSFLSLLFGSGPRSASGIWSLIGFAQTNRTGSTSYTGVSSCGTLLIPTMAGYNYLDQNKMRKAFGSLNISAVGQKEAIVFQIQKFFQIQFKYEPNFKVDSEWVPFFNWAIQQKPFDFTPLISSPSTVYDVTLESTDADQQGLEYQITEMLPEFPNLYDTGMLKLRLKVS